jgi:hypothetical protein
VVGEELDEVARRKGAHAIEGRRPDGGAHGQQIVTAEFGAVALLGEELAQRQVT